MTESKIREQAREGNERGDKTEDLGKLGSLRFLVSCFW